MSTYHMRESRWTDYARVDDLAKHPAIFARADREYHTQLRRFGLDSLVQR